MVDSNAKDVVFSRFCRATVTIIAMQMFLLCTFLIVINANLIRPLVWFGEVFRVLTTITTWLRLIPVLLIIVVEGIIYTQDFTAPQPQNMNRFMQFLSLFSLRNVLISLFQQISGGLLVFIYLSFLTENFKLSKPCMEQSGSCLAEANLFYILNGFWIGFLYRIYEAIYVMDVVVFAPIHLRQLSQIRIKPILIQALKYAITPTLMFTAWYYFWGFAFRGFLFSHLNIEIEDSELDSLTSLFASSLLFNSLLLSTFFLGTMLSIKRIFAIYLSEPMRFNIEAGGTNMTLNESLSNGPHILKMLAARDFYDLAVNDESRRRQIFSLSQPGGHPKNWRNVLQSCISAINEYNAEIENVINCTVEPPAVSGLNPHRINFPPTVVMAQPDNRQFPLENIEKSVKTAIAKEYNSFLSTLSKKPIINYFFGEIAESKLKSLLSQAQYIIWVTQGLSALAASSLYEDKYGIVQNDLSIILTSIVNLKLNIDKLQKLGLLPRKVNHDESLHQLKAALRSSIKRSIYMITVTFKDFIKDIPLSADTSQAIQFFVNFREE